MPLFQAKIGWKIPRKREYKNYRSVPFLPDAKQKISKMPLCHHFKLKWIGKSRERENIKFTFRFVPTQRVIENSKKIAKKFKKFKKSLRPNLRPKQVGNG